MFKISHLNKYTPITWRFHKLWLTIGIYLDFGPKKFTSDDINTKYGRTNFRELMSELLKKYKTPSKQIFPFLNQQWNE